MPHDVRLKKRQRRRRLGAKRAAEGHLPHHTLMRCSIGRTFSSTKRALQVMHRRGAICERCSTHWAPICGRRPRSRNVRATKAAQMDAKPDLRRELQRASLDRARPRLDTLMLLVEVLRIALGNRLEPPRKHLRAAACCRQCRRTKRRRVQHAAGLDQLHVAPAEQAPDVPVLPLLQEPLTVLEGRQRDEVVQELARPRVGVVRDWLERTWKSRCRSTRVSPNTAVSSCPCAVGLYAQLWYRLIRRMRISTSVGAIRNLLQSSAGERALPASLSYARPCSNARKCLRIKRSMATRSAVRNR